MKVVHKPTTYITWDPTWGCNSHCRHCYAEDTIKRKGTKDLSLEQISKVLANLDVQQGTRIRFVGGEPTSREDFLEILCRCFNSGFQPEFATNGTLFTEDLIGSLKGLVGYVNVSLEGPEPCHDWLRGKGMFRRTMNGLQLLSKADIPFGIQTTVFARTMAYLEWVVHIASDVGAIDVNFRVLFPSGRAARMPREMFLDASQMRELAAFVASYHDATKAPNVTVDLYSRAQFLRYLPSIRHVLLTLRQPHIQHDGTVMFFIEAQSEHLSLGSLLNQTLSQIKSSKHFYARREVFDAVLFDVARASLQYGEVSPFMMLLQYYVSNFTYSEGLVGGSCFPYKAFSRQCANCGTCISACYVGARKPGRNSVIVDATLCVGCGECRTSCPIGAIGIGYMGAKDGEFAPRSSE